MENTEQVRTKPKEETVDFVSFRQFVEEATGVPFEEIYKRCIEHGVEHE